MDRTSELEEQVRRLTETVESMRGQVARLEGREPSAEIKKASDRRGFLKLGAGAVLGALGMAAAKVVPAAAATGGNMILGNPNSADASTTLIATGGTPPVQVMGVSAAGTTWVEGTTGTFAGPLQGLGTSTGVVDGVDGWAGGTSGAGVYGVSDSGYGVIGESSTGIGLYARTSGRVRQEGLANPGLPSYTPNLFEQVRDSDGVLWIHNGSGVWRRVNTVRVDTASGSGLPFKPFRRLDTRSGAKKAAGSTTAVTIAGQGAGASAIPADAIAVMGNLAAVSYTGSGFLAIMPQGVAYNPAADPSSVNFIVGQAAIANAFVCGLSGGALQVYVSGHSSHFIVDITAYIQ